MHPSAAADLARNFSRRPPHHLPPAARLPGPQLRVRQHRPPEGHPLFQPEPVGVPLAQPQAFQLNATLLQAALALECTFELAVELGERVGKDHVRRRP